MPVLGVFDSGFGGLTVLRALLPLIPGAHYVYLGDTARLPYGAKSQATIARYAVEAARFLESRGAEMLVIACNTATALALEDIRAAVAIPVIGVVAPGASAALLAMDGTSVSPEGTKPEVLVLATAATVQSHAYLAACAQLGLHATEVACPLLVPLVEEGWTSHPVTREVIHIYLADALSRCTPRAVVLGCTHYPLIAGEIESALRDLGSDAVVVDAARATAEMTALAIGDKAAATPSAPATFECFATDSVEKFRRLGEQFLGRAMPQVTLLDLGG